MLMGCGGGGSTSQDVCDRLDECGALAGASVRACVDALDNELDGLDYAERAEWQSGAKNCLDRSTCDAFLACFGIDGNGGEVDAGTGSDVDAGTGGDVDAGNSGDGTGQLTASWSVLEGDSASTCAAVGADAVAIVSVPSSGTGYRDVFDCDALSGTTFPLPLGSYTVTVQIEDSSANVLGASTPRVETLTFDGQVVNVGNFSFSF